MVVLWYLVLIFWVLVTSSTPVVLPLISNAQDYAELAQQSPSVFKPQSDLLVLGVSSLPASLGHVSQQSVSSLSRRAALSPLNSHSTNLARSRSPSSPMVLEPSLPSSLSVLPLLSYSTILAIIGFISLRIAKWKQRRRARQQAHTLDRDGVELLPTSTATISPRFRDLPVPPPLPPNSPNVLPKSASSISLHSLSSPRPTSPAPAFFPVSRLSRELERPKSPVQHLGFSPNAKIKRRSNSLDLGGASKKRLAHLPTPLRRPFFISEPEPDHDHLLSPRETIYRYKDDDDCDDDLTLIHFSPSHHQRAKAYHPHGSWYSSPNTPFAPPYGTETALIDFSSSLDKEKMSTPVKRDVPVSAHAAFDIEVPRTPPPPASLPPPLVASPKPPLHGRSGSSESENLIDFSPKPERKALGDEPHYFAVEAPVSTQVGDAEDSPISDKAKGYEGGDEDEMDITLDDGRELQASLSSPTLMQREVSKEEDVVDGLQNLEGGLSVGQPLSAVSSASSSEPVVDVVGKMESSEESFEGEVDDMARSIDDEIIDQTASLVSQSPSPVVVALAVDQPDGLDEHADSSRQEVDLDTTLVEEARVPDDVVTSTMEVELRDPEKEEDKDNAVHEFNDLNESEDLSYLANHSLNVNGPTHSEVDGGLPEVDEAFVEVSLPPSPIPSDCDSLPDLGEVEAPVSVDKELIGNTKNEEVSQSLEPLLSTDVLQEGFPDPELLPLPQMPLPTFIKSLELETSTTLSSSSSPLSPHSPHQIPTPPASPPSSPRLTGLSNITNRPAWSVRAVDMPPLGIHASAVHGLHTRKSFGELGGRRNDENWDLVKRRKLGKMKEERKAPDEGEGEDENEAPAGEDKEVEVPSEPALAPTVVVEPAPRSSIPSPEGLLSPTTTFTLLPGSFPTDVLPAVVNEKSVSRSAVVEVPVEAQVQTETKESQGVSTSLTVPNTQRRPVRRSALDIALAMQLRPGLGVGADPAWMVRFLMAMFGWFVVLISGSTGDAYGYGMAGAGIRGL